ncbi:hypothetical protein MBLNU457_1671t2 [Dothideomycetes sp. NU457]
MALALGKRKRVAVPSKGQHKAAKIAQPEQEEEDDNEDLRDAFRRAFEAKFKPLSGAAKKAKAAAKAAERDDQENNGVEDMRDEDESGSDFEGLSSDDGDDNADLNYSPAPTVQVISHTDTYTADPTLHKAEKKAYMSSKPPTSSSHPTPSHSSKPTSTAPDENETANLQNDIALQRLLTESHLLDPSKSTSLNPSGANRHKATDLRLLNLGSKTSILAQKNMPLAHRKGIARKAGEREERRRREARENGVVLERVVKKDDKGEKRRERGVGGPSVGRMRGGTLVLSQRDVRGIEGPRRGGRGGGRGGRGRGRGRGR